jgi:glycosyltransferase involved in cell wall biosynthesis
MARCAKESVVFRDVPITVIPNPIETDHLWHPLPRDFARSVLGLQPNKKYILSGSAGGSPHIKGEDLLKQAMNKVAVNGTDSFELLIFGQYQPAGHNDWPCKVHWLGPVRDDHVMSVVYSAADVMIVPSRQDNLPNTAVEAHACGVPVVAFNIGGLPDIVEHQKSGWLASAFDTDNLAEGISWVLGSQERRDQLSVAARNIAQKRFSTKVIVQQYMRVYEQAQQLHRGHHCV